MADTTTLADYAPGSPEAAEWRSIRARNVETFRRRGTFNRIDPDRRPALLDLAALREEATRLADAVGEHLDLVAALSSSGWLLFPDVSEHQGAFNWQWCVDAGFKVGCYKATEGRTYVDGQAARNAAEIRRLGLLGMCYGFVFWSAEYDTTPALWNEQGVWFAKHAPADFAHAIDVEMLCTGRSTDVARVVAGYRSVYPGHPLIIYTNRSLYVSRSKGTPSNPATLGLLEWHAGIGNGYYTSATGSLPAEWGATSALTNSLTGFPPAVVWQFTDHGAVAGQLVDGNGFSGTPDDFRRAFITGGAADDMSQADVDAIVSQLKTFITSEVDRIVHDRLASPWVTASGYGDAAAPGGKISPVGMTYQNYVQHKALLTQIGVAVADDPSIAQITAALGAQVDPMSQAVVAGLKDALPASVGLDYDRVGQIVAVKLDEHVRSFTISTDAPPAAAAGAETEPGQGQG